jgi:hypothetical protein
MTARWLSEPDRPTDLPWFFDAPWEAANGRHNHTFIRRHGSTGSQVTVSHELSTLGQCGPDALRQVLYGNHFANPQEMTGLAQRYDTHEPNAVNVLDAGGFVGLCSAWLLGWGPRTICMVSPDGDPPSLGGECCVAVMDWRYAVRIANIDATSPEFDARSWLSQAALRIPSVRCNESLRPIFYINRDVQARLKDYGPGDPLVSSDLSAFRGIPIRVVDELRSDEARV